MRLILKDEMRRVCNKKIKKFRRDWIAGDLEVRMSRRRMEPERISR